MVQMQIEQRLELIDQEIAAMKKEIIGEAAVNAFGNDGVDGEGAILNQRTNDRIGWNAGMREKLIATMLQQNGANSRKWKCQYSQEMIRIHAYSAERSSRDGTILGKFLRIKQETTIEEYHNLFDKLVAPLSNVQEKVVEDTFMNGLFPWIRAEVAFCRPKGFEMMQVAQLVENKELMRNEASLNGFSGGKYPSQTVSSSKPTVGNTLFENKGNTTFPIRTIILRSSNANEVRKEANSRRLPEF
ncbi:transposon Tf2-1 polyprotein isoform X1 [Cucumis melo var. makuwa]|uniref:Transposon Tf2-1 polyprotein isoform X1 n=1 Tax=Cucumis melo var. makuwa TaxID=1194695 RepID=A0A5D3C2H2_CUCMM|nr:transposon Tf2-1 polyprotein isoform X1 [Cucumis melo var. makuwa]